MDVVIDDNPLKQNLYTPGTNTIIKPASYIKTFNQSDKILFIPLAWNFYKEIKKRIKDERNNSNDLFVEYFPNLNITK